MVTTKQQFIVDSQKIKRRESKCTTMEIHQFTHTHTQKKEVREEKETKELKNNRKELIRWY